MAPFHKAANYTVIQAIISADSIGRQASRWLDAASLTGVTENAAFAAEGTSCLVIQSMRPS